VEIIGQKIYNSYAQIVTLNNQLMVVAIRVRLNKVVEGLPRKRMVSGTIPYLL
jgi:hypothetical protein